jgi:NAD(P)-dependent dehydrogenase (short-subunit alcohol dehydrogenase family)
MLEDRVVVVTGAAHGLGRATAEAVAAAGGTVVMNDLGVAADGTGSDEEPLEEAVAEIRAAGGTATASFGDVTDADYIAALVEETFEEYGRIDGAINYAGYLRDGMVFSLERADWEAVLEVHLTGHFNLVHHLGAHWRTQYKAGNIDSQRSIVAVSSAAARGSVSQVNYSAAKAGILGLVRTAARDLHRYDVRVNAMMPGAMTRMISEGVPEEMVERLPVDRIGPEKVTPLPVVLLSDAAEDVTGWTFAIGGDTVFTVTDPEFDRSAIMKGGWTPEDLAGTLDQLLDGRERSKTAPGGLLGRLARD